MNVLVIAHLKSSYEDWKSLFDADAERANFCDESQTKVGRVDEHTGMITLFDVDMEGWCDMSQCLDMQFWLVTSTTVE